MKADDQKHSTTPCTPAGGGQWPPVMCDEDKYIQASSPPLAKVDTGGFSY